MIKYIGQHIFDFIARFRNDIYMESIPDGTIASGKNLGLDDNNKVVKSSSPSGSIDLTSEVTGTLPVANGGTGATSLNNLITLSTHTTGDYVASLTAGSLIDLQNNTGEGATPTIDVDLSELTDMTGSWTTAEDEFVVLDNGTQKRKLSSEIFGSNAFTDTTIGTTTNALTFDDATVQLNTGTTFDGSAARTVSAKTAAVSNGGAALATGDQIYDFVTGLGYVTSNTTYGISCEDGDNSDEEKIRLTDSDGTTDDIVLEAGTGLSITRSLDKITFTNTVAASTDVTLTGTPDYITISGQEITRNQIDLAADVTGVLPSANLDSDTAHLSGTQTFTGSKTFSAKCTVDSRVYGYPGTNDGDHVAGDVVYFGGTTGMTAGKCYYLNSGGNWTLSNADAEADASGLLAIALGTSSNSDGMLLRGMVTPYSLAGTDDYGKKVYLRTTDGILTTSAPTNSGDIVRIVGYMLHDSNDAIYFCPDNTYIELS